MCLQHLPAWSQVSTSQTYLCDHAFEQALVFLNQATLAQGSGYINNQFSTPKNEQIFHFSHLGCLILLLLAHHLRHRNTSSVVLRSLLLLYLHDNTFPDCQLLSPEIIEGKTQLRGNIRGHSLVKNLRFLMFQGLKVSSVKRVQCRPTELQDSVQQPCEICIHRDGNPNL